MTKTPLVFVAGFAIGAALFFPFRLFTSQIEQTLARSAGIDVRLGDLHVGTGLGLGLGRGGLLAVKGQNVRVTLRSGASFSCNEFVLSPVLLGVFTGALKFGVSCDLGDNGEIIGTAALKPFWAPQTIEANLKADGVRLNVVDEAFALGGLSGRLNGEFGYASPLAMGFGRLPALTWSLAGSEVNLPPVSSDLLNLPSIPMGTISSRGRLSDVLNKLDIEEFRFGAQSTPLEGSIRGSVTMDRRGQPNGADITGQLRSDPDFEKSQLKDINLDLIFGRPRRNGIREFHKKAEGSLLGLFMNPPLDN